MGRCSLPFLEQSLKIRLCAFLKFTLEYWPTENRQQLSRNLGVLNGMWQGQVSMAGGP
jgi:hypothetical protein